MNTPLYNKIINLANKKPESIRYRETPTDLGFTSVLWLEQGATRISVKRNFIALPAVYEHITENNPINVFDYDCNIVIDGKTYQKHYKQDNSIGAKLFEQMLFLYNSRHVL